MDPKVTKQLIKTSKTLRQKFKSMKRGLQLSEEELERNLKPITKPLQELVDQSKQPRVKKIKISPLKKDVSTSTETLVHTSTPVQRKKFIPIKREKEETFEDEEGNEQESIKSEEEEEEEEMTPLQRIIQFDKDKLQKSMEEYEGIGPLFKPYLLKVTNSDTKDMDDRYGIRILPTGGMVVGNAQASIDGNNIIVNNKMYVGTPGLFQLLFLKKPTMYTEDDLEKYRDILNRSQAHKQQFSYEKNISASKGWKYNNIIAPLFSSTKKSSTLVETRFTPPSSSSYSKTPLTLYATKPTRYQTRSKFPSSGSGMWEGQSIYEYWDDPNELVDRLRLLHASTMAGHTGHENEMQSIIEELREADIIY